MTVFLHELRRCKWSLIIWAAAISFMLGVTVIIYPEMSSQMNEISEMFADMGSFSAAFGMDQINFGEFLGFFAVECGNVLGLGGAFFAAIIGISALSKEEKERTAELLLTQPISRKRIITEKLCSIIAQIAILNACVIGVVALCIVIIGESVAVKTLALIILAYFILQIEIALISFGVSAFISKGGLGIGIGVAVMFYFMNIISNLTKDLEFLKYITPFGYTDGAQIISSNTLNMKYIGIGIVFCAIGTAAAYIKYTKKDIS